MEYNVTVLMSTFNGERFIQEQIDSILKQKECNVNLIVRDDGSTDNTIKILDEYYLNGNLNYYSGENLGPAKSFMTLIQNASINDYYAFSDQDDVWDDIKLLRGIEKIRNISYEPALYCSNLRTVDETLTMISDGILPIKISTEFLSIIVGSGNLFGCTMVFNKAMSSYVKSKEMPNYMIMHDLWLGIIASLYDNLYYDGTPYINYRIHSNNFTRNKNNKVIHYLKKLNELFVLKPQYCISRQCQSFIKYTGEEILELKGEYGICRIVSYYADNLLLKMKLVNLMIRKKNISSRQRSYQILLIIFNKF